MLTLIVGGTRKARIEKREKLLDSFSNTTPYMITDTTSADELAILFGGTSLFGGDTVCIGDDVLTGACGEFIIDHCKTFVDAETVGIISEESVGATILKAMIKAGVILHELKAVEKSVEKFSVFTLTDACLLRDRKRAWVILMEARHAESVPVEIVGMLFWMAKTMLLINTLKTDAALAEAGLKPFVVSKTKRHLKLWSDGEIRKLATSLITLSHDVRYQSEDDAWMMIEKTILTTI